MTVLVSINVLMDTDTQTNIVQVTSSSMDKSVIGHKMSTVVALQSHPKNQLKLQLKHQKKLLKNHAKMESIVMKLLVTNFTNVHMVTDTQTNSAQLG